MKVCGLTFLSGPPVMSAPLMVCKCALGNPGGNMKDVAVQAEGQGRGTSIHLEQSAGNCSHVAQSPKCQGREGSGVGWGWGVSTAAVPWLPHALLIPAQDVLVQPGVVY